jgi:hypothetical protein
VRGLAVGVVPGVVFGLPWLLGSRHDIPTALVILALVVGIGLASGLVSGLRTTSEERLALGQDAGRVIHDDLVSGLVVGLAWLPVLLPLTAGLLFAIGYERYHQQREAYERQWSFECVVDRLGGRCMIIHHDFPPVNVPKPSSLLPATGLLFGFVVVVVVASVSARASGRYAIASLLFGFTETFPRRPARFLEWARNAGLLRVTGVAYQFRHDTYGEWLAAGGGTRDLTVRSDPPADARSR